jgi:hypothetical protein
LFTPEIRSEIAQLRRIRNDVVHVKRLPPAEEIREARERLTALVVELASRPPSPSA